MEKSLFEKITNKFNRLAIYGILSCFIVISVSSFFSSYFLNKIPKDAKYEDVFERSKDYDGSEVISEYRKYDSELFDNYNRISQVLFYSPILIALILELIKEFKKWRLKERMSEIEAKNGRDALRVYRDSYDYKYFKDSKFYNYFSGYLIGLLGIISYGLVDGILEMIFGRLF